VIASIGLAADQYRQRLFKSIDDEERRIARLRNVIHERNNLISSYWDEINTIDRVRIANELYLHRLVRLCNTPCSDYKPY